MSAERRGPAICNVSNIGEGKDEMTKASIDLQDLRRRIYVKAKAEPSWRFWGLYVHVCKMETLRAAYEMAKKNDGAPGIDGVIGPKLPRPSSTLPNWTSSELTDGAAFDEWRVLGPWLSRLFCDKIA